MTSRNTTLRAIRKSLMDAERKAKEAAKVLYDARQRAWSQLEALGVGADDYDAWCRAAYGDDTWRGMEAWGPREDGIAQSVEIRVVQTEEEPLPDLAITPDDDDDAPDDEHVPHETTEPANASDPAILGEDSLMARAGVYDYYEPDA